MVPGIIPITLFETDDLTSTSNLVEMMKENEILCDYISARFRLELRGDVRPLVIAESISEFLKRAPQRMAAFYRSKTAIGLRGLISVFDNQGVPKSLFDYQKYKDRHKGEEIEKILDTIKSESETIDLPQIVYTANTVSLYSPAYL